MQIGANGYFKAHPSPALWRSIGSGFLHSYTCAFQRIAASIRPRFDPFIEALLQAEDEAKRWKRDLDRAETELIEAVRSIR